ncbi:MAG: glycosyltransferase family 2 protein [Bacteroidales bacterium]|nr:glycosyltransferase family 2 protein [Bacteroidales bacterium]
MIVLFFILIGCVFYSYVGYGLLLWLITSFRSNKNNVQKYQDSLPPVTLVIPAYNELYIVDKKMHNTKELYYPTDKLTVVWITDGSNDGTPEYLRKHYPEVVVWHETDRKGKAAAINRALSLVDTEIVVFCDANTMLNKESIQKIVTHFNNPKIGVVAGEKRVLNNNEIAGSGESLYWKYESWLKQLNAKFYSSIGAVGELFAVKKSLATPIPEDTIIDDFVLSMQIANKGYIIAYEPQAIACEEPSDNEKEEMKRKVRIAAGAFQTLFRYLDWLNVFKTPVLSFQYISYKVIRWFIVPIALPLIFIFNILILLTISKHPFFLIFFVLQVMFYFIVSLNLFIKHLPKIFFIPYYFVLMNVAQYVGFYKYITNKQSAAWEKVKRKTDIISKNNSKIINS